jgi:enoyl-CoA hydratase/carnithine racemase
MTDIHVARDGFVATVTIDKPPINAVSVDLMRDLADEAAAVVTGEGLDFPNPDPDAASNRLRP